MSSARSALDTDLRAAVAAVNRIAATIADLNAELRSDFRARTDPNLEASLYASLEDLAQYIDFTALRQDDGSVMVLIGGGQAPLVIGDRQFAIEYAAGTGSGAVLTADGRDVTAAIGAGQLRGLLDLKNSVLPGYIGEVDRLAEAVAARINGLLASGLDAAGQAGAALFAWNAGAPAATLSVTGIQPSQLAAASAGAPGGNGNALALAALADSIEIEGLSFTAFYGSLASAVGRDVENARASADAGEQLYQAASALRDDDSKVSLDEEAARLIEFQRAYEAVAKVIVVLDELTETTIGLLRR